MPSMQLLRRLTSSELQGSLVRAVVADQERKETTASGVNPLAVLICEKALTLGLAAGCFLDLGLVLAAGSGAGSLGGGLLAGGALDLLALDFVGDGGGVCHVMSSLCAA